MQTPVETRRCRVNGGTYNVTCTPEPSPQEQLRTCPAPAYHMRAELWDTQALQADKFRELGDPRHRSIGVGLEGERQDEGT